MSQIQEILEPIRRTSKDMFKAMTDMPIGDEEARYLVDMYYQMQKERVGMNNRVKGLNRDAKKNETKEEPHTALDFFLDQFRISEENVKKVLGSYAGAHEMSWFFDQTLGIGPVIAAGLCAHIDIEKAPTAGAIWKFAGLDPSTQWAKGKKRPFNAQLKVLCWKLGDSFVKVSGREDAFYGKVYKERKALEVERNEAGLFADQAKAKLEKFNIGKTTDAYKAYSAGKLPAAHLDARARRYAVKLFLSHLQQRWREHRGLLVVAPWAIAQGGHAHVIEPPQKLAA